MKFGLLKGKILSLEKLTFLEFTIIDLRFNVPIA